MARTTQSQRQAKPDSPLDLLKSPLVLGAAGVLALVVYFAARKAPPAPDPEPAPAASAPAPAPAPEPEPEVTPAPVFPAFPAPVAEAPAAAPAPAPVVDVQGSALTLPGPGAQSPDGSFQSAGPVPRPQR
jgi:hypothetical protein